MVELAFAEKYGLIERIFRRRDVLFMPAKLSV